MCVRKPVSFMGEKGLQTKSRNAVFLRFRCQTLKLFHSPTQHLHIHPFNVLALSVLSMPEDK